MGLTCEKCHRTIDHPMTESTVIDKIEYFSMIHQFTNEEIVLCSKCEAIYQTEIREKEDK